MNLNLDKQKRAELEDRLLAASGSMKMVLGASNNMAYIAIFNAMDKVKKHPRYKHAVKGSFAQALKEFQAYQNNLIYGPLQWFDVDGMPPETRKRYGNITDKDYYEFWQCGGSSAWKMCNDEINVIRNKYLVSMRNHDVSHPEIMCEVMLASTMLCMAAGVYKRCIEEFGKNFRVSAQISRKVWSDFDMSRIECAWNKALLLLGNGEKYDLSPSEVRNLELTFDQMAEKLNDKDVYYDSVLDNIEGYEDIFRTKGEWKKVMREITEEKNSIE